MFDPNSFYGTIAGFDLALGYGFHDSDYIVQHTYFLYELPIYERMVKYLSEYVTVGI